MKVFKETPSSRKTIWFKKFKLWVVILIYLIIAAVIMLVEYLIAKKL